MRIFVTPPMNHLELSELGDKNFYILGQLYKKSEAYREYAKRAKLSGRFTILDSGVGDEGEVLTNEELFELTKELEPNEVIPLDVLYNRNETMKNFKQFVEWLKEEHAQGNLMYTTLLACPQGKNWDEWMDCYRYFLMSRYVTCIGMSKKAIPHIMESDNIAYSRSVVVSRLKSMNLIKKQMHFLGQGDPREFIPYTGARFRSTDSCYPILAAMNGIDLSVEGKFQRIPTPSDYFEREVPEEIVPLIKKNIDFLRQCCNDVL